MASFSDYLDTAYLPGQVYSAGLSDSTASPQDKMTYMANKKFKFKPGSDAGEYFQQFLALQNNPETALMAGIQLPKGFTDAMSGFSR
jgi:hypothetical protein